MMQLDYSRGVLFVLLAAVVVSSGCIENSSTSLDSDFSLDYEQVDLNSSGMDVYQASMVRADNVSSYAVDSDNKMAMNLPVISISVNMTSEGLFDQDSYEVNSSGTMGFNVGGNSNATEFNTRISSTENGTEVEKEVMDRENQTEEQYSREDLGISLEALEAIDVENASILGVSNLSGEENILLGIDVNSSDLMRSSEGIFEVHSPVQESADEGGDMSEVGEFNEVEAYLWTGREDRVPSQFAYYGSAQNGSLQLRSVTEYSER